MRYKKRKKKHKKKIIIRKGQRVPVKITLIQVRMGGGPEVMIVFHYVCFLIQKVLENIHNEKLCLPAQKEHYILCN